MHQLYAKQLARACRKDGSLDVEKLGELVSRTYAEADDERRRSDHAIRTMMQELDHRAEHDPMTGLANRTRFTTELKQAMGLIAAPRNAAVLFLDLDRFKEVNDTMGHFAGDELLRLVARRLRDVVGHRGISARLGGDEFAVVQHDIECAANAGDLARDIINVLSRPYDLEGATVTIGVSIGIALTPEHGRSINDLQRRADMALYRAKQSQRGTWCYFEQEMDDALSSRKAFEIDLRNALVNAEFELHFQPIVDAETHLVNTFEALIRWYDPRRGLIPPDQFIPVAESSGLIVPIGEWVIRHACVQALKLPDHINIAINISPVQLRSDRLVDVFRSTFDVTGIAPERIELEITESVLIADDPRTLKVLDDLRGLGIRFSLDDFGTGYSSLSYLQKFHFDRIKIDRSFCASVNSNPTNAALVRAVAALGRDLGIDVVAEGVESIQESRTLHAEGCNFLQGYFHGRPASIDSLNMVSEAAIIQLRDLERQAGKAMSQEPPAERRRTFMANRARSA